MIPSCPKEVFKYMVFKIAEHFGIHEYDVDDKDDLPLFTILESAFTRNNINIKH